jgi:cation diffusion facilitator CzcD-associated flavoprotein CzcO
MVKAFPFDPNPNWSNFYSTGPEIHEYMQRIVKKWDLDRDVEFNTRVTGCWWQEQLGKWKIKVEHEGVEREEYADILISGQGFLKYVWDLSPPIWSTFTLYCSWGSFFVENSSPDIYSIWKWPDIPGLHDFKGCLVHSANWDHEYDYSHKRIALIGNGSSGIQILPQIAKLEGTDVTSFQRGPTWVIARMSPGSLLGKSDLSSNPEYTEEEKKKFREDPVFHNKYRKQLIHRINKAFRMVNIPGPLLLASC